jgi:hypothetical protein
MTQAATSKAPQGEHGTSRAMQRPRESIAQDVETGLDPALDAASVR